MSPSGSGRLGDFQFHLTPDPSMTYDLVVCYERVDRPLTIKVRRGCTVFVPGEPSEIKSFSTPFINQFNYLLTFRTDLVKRHNRGGHFLTNCLTPWRIGLDENLERVNAPRSIRSYDTIKKYQPSKSLDLSMVVSNKTGTPLQRTRLKLAQILHQQFTSSGKFHLFGRGVRDIQDSAVALDNFRFSICIENSELPNYFTEKITNAFLTNTIPLYWGCPNVTDFFETMDNPLFILDPYDIEGSVQKIHYILQNSEALYNSYLPLVLKDKQKILDNYNIYARVVEIIPTVESTYTELYLGLEEIETLNLIPDTTTYYA
jgi:hypothetical protein